MNLKNIRLQALFADGSGVFSVIFFLQTYLYHYRQLEFQHHCSIQHVPFRHLFIFINFAI